MAEAVARRVLANGGVAGLRGPTVARVFPKDATQDEKFETPENVQADLKIYAAYGVTTVQVLGTDKNFVIDMRNQQRKGRPTMARLFSAGQGAVMKGGYGGLVGVTQPISTPEEVAWSRLANWTGMNRCTGAGVSSSRGASGQRRQLCRATL